MRRNMMKSQMVKRILALILALATLVSFVSCSTPLNIDELFGYGEKSDENNSGEKPNQDEKPGDTACEHEWSEDFVIAMHESAYCYEYACGKCTDKKYVEMELISVSDKWLYDEVNHWNNLKCNETVAKVEMEDEVTGVSSKVVKVAKNYSVNVAEHNFDENGVCADCKYNSMVSVGLEYLLNAEGTGYIVVGRGTCTDEHINIPAEYEGLPVVAIGDNAFEDILPEEEPKEEVTPTASVSVTDENGLRVLGVTIPDTVISISCTAFAKCEELNNFIVDLANTVYSATNNCLIDNVLKSVVRGCEFSVIPDDGQVTAIGSYAFAGSSGLVSITIPETVEDIGDKAFMECDALIEVYMPENINVGIDVFRGSIHVEIKIEHTLVYVPAKDATCEEAGNIEYYVCTDCGFFYADENYEVRLYEVNIPALHFFVDGVCTECGKVQDEVLIVRIDNIAHLGMFPLGTLEDAIGLPKAVNVTTKDGVTHELAVVWDLTTYNKAEVGEYVITGVIQSGALHYAEGLDNKLEVGIEIVEKMVGTADIVFVLDISGSMGSYITNVKNNMIRIAQAIEDAGVSARWSVITYSDFSDVPGDPNEVTQVRMNGASDWSTNAEDCKNIINSISLAYGGDGPEVSVDGLLKANTLENRKNARVFYILLTDADYKIANNYGVTSTEETINILVESGVNVSVIASPSYYPLYTPFTNATGGVLCNINGNFSQTLVDSLVPIIFGEVVS